MSLVAYAVSAKAMCQLQFWAGQENYREYRNALWSVGEVILRADHLESNVFNRFLDRLSSESGVSFASLQAPVSGDIEDAFLVCLVLRPSEQPQRLRQVQSLSTNKEPRHKAPAFDGMKSGHERAFASAREFLRDALQFMGIREDETLVIASC